VVPVREAQLAGVAPVEAAALPEDLLHAEVVIVGVEVEIGRPERLIPLVAEARQCPGLLTHVVLGVAAAGAEREELHHLAAVVLVRRRARVVDA
jgi:hypothetical protein